MIFKGAYSDYFGFIYIDPIFTLTNRQVLGTKRKRPTNQKINRVFAVRTGSELIPLYPVNIKYLAM